MLYLRIGCCHEGSPYPPRLYEQIIGQSVSLFSEVPQHNQAIGHDIPPSWVDEQRCSDHRRQAQQRRDYSGHHRQRSHSRYPIPLGIPDVEESRIDECRQVNESEELPARTDEANVTG